MVDGCGGGLWANGEGSHQNRELILGLINQYNSIFCILLLLLLLIFFNNAVANVVIKVNTEGTVGNFGSLVCCLSCGLGNLRSPRL